MISEKLQVWEDEKNEAYIKTYLLEDSKEFNQGKKRPLVIVCPGGAYLGTSDREAESVALRFNSYGYHAVVLRYNTYFGELNWEFKEEMSVKTACLWPNPLYDLAKTMAMVQQQKEAWLVDEQRIMLCGFSAGGNLVGNMATRWHEPWLAEKVGISSDELRPHAAIIGYPVTDYFLLKELNKMRGDEGVIGLFKMANLASFGVIEPSDEQLTSISPVYAVSDKTIPMYIWHTAADKLVYSENALHLALALCKYQIPYELHIFQEGGHGLSLCDETTAAEPGHINHAAYTWFDMAMTWLKGL